MRGSTKFLLLLVSLALPDLRVPFVGVNFLIHVALKVGNV